MNKPHPRLDEKAVERVSGKAWEALKPAFFEASRLLLDVDERAVSQLTTIYVKYQLKHANGITVFAVSWLKSSAELVVGLALPSTELSDLLVSAPPGKTYAGLTKYLVVKPGETLPPELGQWAAKAFEHACGAIS